MAHLKILQSVSGVDFSWSAGEIVEVSDDDAATWADGYRAVLEDGTVVTPYVDPDAPAPVIVEVITGDANPADGPVETPEDADAVETPEDADAVETPEDADAVETPEDKPRARRKAAQ